MAGKITNFLREAQFPISIILTIFGFVVLFIGATGLWYNNLCFLPKAYLDWSFYLLLIGFFVFIAGVYYLFIFLKNRKFVLEELETNKRSELLKRHNELKSTVKHMPSKFQKMLSDKEEELRIK